MKGTDPMQRRRAVIVAGLLLQIHVAAVADTIFFVDGASVDGDVVELGGNSIALQTPGGRRKIHLGEIRRVEFTRHEHETTTLETDLVLCRNGNDLSGTVRRTEDGKSIEVTFADGNRAVLPLSQVLKIFKKGEQKGRDTSIHYTAQKETAIREDLEALASPVPDVGRRAEASLKDFGIFAIGLVEEAREKSSSPASVSEQALERIMRLYELKKVVSDVVERSFPGIYRTFDGTAAGGGSDQQKEETLHELFSRHPDEAVPVAIPLLLDPGQHPGLRALIVGMLSGLQRNHELVDLYGKTRGQVQLSVAIALGKNRILLGVPTLLQGLELDSRIVRRLCFENLKDFTGEEFGYHPDDTPRSRRRAVARWKKWWKNNGEAICVQSMAMLAGKSEETSQRIEARDLWTRAGASASEKRFPEAEALLRQAVRVDPGFFQAHIHLAVILYSCQDGGDRGTAVPTSAVLAASVDEAERILGDLVSRRIASVSERQMCWVHYHLARIAELKRNPDRAMSQLRLCVAANPTFYVGQKAFGDLAYRKATGSAELAATERRLLLQLAVQRYRATVDLVEDRERELVIIVREDLPLADVPPVDMRKHNRTVLDVRLSLRLMKTRSLLGIARAESLLGDREKALSALLDGLSEVRDETRDEGAALHVTIRNYLAVLYEGNGEFQAAIREFTVVLKNLDQSNEVALAGVKRLGREHAGATDDRRDRRKVKNP